MVDHAGPSFGRFIIGSGMTYPETAELAMTTSASGQGCGGYVFGICRVANHLTRREAGASVGCGRSHLSRIENDRARPVPGLYWRMLSFHVTGRA